MSTEPSPPDPRALRGLAHPLRLQLLGRLRSDGPSTATRLAAALGESSGATSYHLRQLAAHGFIVPDDDPARPTSGRERWWRASARYTDLPRAAARGGDPGAEGFLRALAVDFHRETLGFLGGLGTLPAEWEEGWTLSDRFLRLTPGEARRLRGELAELISRFRLEDPEAGPRAPTEAQRVLVQLQILPQPGNR